MKHEFTLRRGKEADIDEVARAMELVKQAMVTPDWFVAEDRQYIADHMDGVQGFTIVAETKDHVFAGFFIVDYPRDREENLGNDIHMNETESMLVAHMDIAAVLPSYRGNGLMTKLLVAAEAEVAKTKYQHLMCTVHPDNGYSLNQVTAHGYLIVATKEKYGGRIRHVLYKKQEPNKPVILVSACLLGVRCRYNETGVLEESIKDLMQEAVLIPVCPEILGGLPTPREPAERVQNQVITITGIDVTAQYQKGAKEVLKLTQLYDCNCALLKERSPSCGCGRIYDGSHTGILIDGDGMTADLLKKHGIYVFGERKIEELKDFIETM